MRVIIIQILTLLIDKALSWGLSLPQEQIFLLSYNLIYYGFLFALIVFLLIYFIIRYKVDNAIFGSIDYELQYTLGRVVFEVVLWWIVILWVYKTFPIIANLEYNAWNIAQTISKTLKVEIWTGTTVNLTE